VDGQTTTYSGLTIFLLTGRKKCAKGRKNENRKGRKADMSKDYNVSVRITVTKDTPETIVNMEDKAFVDLSFEKMTRASAEYYELIARIEKAIK